MKEYVLKTNKKERNNIKTNRNGNMLQETETLETTAKHRNDIKICLTAYYLETQKNERNPRYRKIVTTTK